MQRTGLIHVSIQYMITEREGGRERERESTHIYLVSNISTLLNFYLTKDVVSSLDSEVLAVSIPVVGTSPLSVKMLISSLTNSSPS